MAEMTKDRLAEIRGWQTGIVDGKETVCPGVVPDLLAIIDELVVQLSIMRAAMKRYEADADPEIDAPPEHVELMNRADDLLTRLGFSENRTGEKP